MQARVRKNPRVTPGNTPASPICTRTDGAPVFAGHCAIAECRLEGSPGFAAFVYPGSLPGHTFALTDAGLAVTVNNLRQRQVKAVVPRMVLTRAVLDARGLADARALRECCVAERRVQRGCSVQAIMEPSLHANHGSRPRVGCRATRKRPHLMRSIRQ
ncbi:carcinine hydrolase/isopenicillin-N N-acyltransferase family protein [Paraburkholderia franconis]|uniref:carcinine hydrolase/isopenicillin-N N-acyltransferase family protein n=1 Tax=Paraburkholderia franconis TaxID=2654983 RepID=UPI001D108CE9|nr:carcinine hydrolase/isopenicillin-N N-acyltransferase family protein [Paraburkholderia franconis]